MIFILNYSIKSIFKFDNMENWFISFCQTDDSNLVPEMITTALKHLLLTRY